MLKSGFKIVTDELLEKTGFNIWKLQQIVVFKKPIAGEIVITKFLICLGKNTKFAIAIGPSGAGHFGVQKIMTWVISIFYM